MVGPVKELLKGRALTGVVAQADLSRLVLDGDGWEGREGGVAE